MIKISLVCEKCGKEENIIIKSGKYFLEGSAFYKTIKENDFRIVEPPASIDRDEYIQLLLCVDCAKKEREFIRTCKKKFDRQILESFGAIYTREELDEAYEKFEEESTGL